MIKILQIFYGSILIIFGLNGFFSFLPIPEKQGFALEFLNALHHAGYIFPTVASIMIATGTLLLINRWVTFGLLILLPVSFNIFAFHCLHDFPGLPAALALFALNLFFLFKHREDLKHAFKSR